MTETPIKISAHGEMTWKPTGEELAGIVERLEELADWAEEEVEAPAVTNKLREALGPLRAALDASQQYRVGLLPHRPALDVTDVACPRCQVDPDVDCKVESPSRWSMTWRYGKYWHDQRVQTAHTVTFDRDRQLMEMADRLLNQL